MKSIPTKTFRNCLALMAAVLATGLAQAQTININLTAGGADERGLVGPAGGAGMSWNQFPGADSTVTMVDSTGADTSVTLDTNFGLTAFDPPIIDLLMLRGSMSEFGKGTDDRNVTLSGLEVGGLYDVWLVSLRNQPVNGSTPPDTEQYVGWWSTSNTSTSSSDQLVDARGAVVNTSTFVVGYNFVLFENVEADGGGNIIFTGTAGPLLDGSNDDYRFGLNGLQLRPSDLPAGPVDADISAVAASPATVAADGVSTSTITVTLRDAIGKAVEGKEVTLANTGGEQAAVIAPVGAQTSDENGVAIFTVSSNTVGMEEFAATDVTDANLLITQTASVEFTEVIVTGPVDAAVSTVEASSAAVVADGTSLSTITVTLKDSNGNPVADKDVTLANNAGPQAAAISPVGVVTTDVDGKASFTVSSSTIGVEEFAATDVSDGNLVITQTASVEFADPDRPLVLNVNIYQSTSGIQIPPFEGPAGGLNEVWDQRSSTSVSALVDSIGSPTGVGYSFNRGVFGDWGNPADQISRDGLANFDTSAENSQQLVINGLNPGDDYDVWIVSNNALSLAAASNQRARGEWSTPNASITVGSQTIDNTIEVNDSAWLQGNNFVLFEGVEADVNGELAFDGFSTPGDGFDSRLPVNAFQLRKAAPAVTLAITDIVYTPDAVPNPTVTLTWRKTEALSYIVKYSLDMIDWDADLDDGILPEHDENPEDVDHITVTFSLVGELKGEPDAFFRIEE
ncbi:hypothetical protein GYB43_12230 [bacterium]|nr:hypothetical protein [bacterium]